MYSPQAVSRDSRRSENASHGFRGAGPAGQAARRRTVAASLSARLLVIGLLVVFVGPVFAAGDSASPPDTSASPEACLRAICDRLLDRQQPNGLFEAEAGPWWEVSFEVRALLAAHEIFGDGRYLTAAKKALGCFMAAQDEDGGWCAFHPDVGGAGADCASRNLADLGTITACLSLIVPELSPTERDAAIRAHRRYFDLFAKAGNRADGSYANGLFEGRNESFPYSVATATQAVSLVALYRSTGDSLSLRRAEKAARVLMAGWLGDGRPLLSPHEKPTPALTATTTFGDLYYVLEALLWVEGATSDAALRETIRSVLRIYIYGREGLLRRTAADGWIAPPGEPSSGCKGNGMLGILLAAQTLLDPEPSLQAWTEEGVRRLCSPAQRGGYGVLEPPPAGFGQPGAICEVFAAISLAERIRPGVAYGRPPR